MTRFLLAGLVALPMTAVAAFAAPPQIGMVLGQDVTSIRKSLDDMGYDIHEIGADADIIEAEISDSEGNYDLEVDPTTGLVVFVEIDTDGDGDV